MATSKVRLKLLIDTKGKKVLFAEASKDFVDFLFYIFSLPVGTVVKLLKEKISVGCLDKLYESIENLSETYMQPNHHDKNSVLNPKSSISATEIPLSLSLHESNIRKFYTCDNYTTNYNRNSYSAPTYQYNVSDEPNVMCPQCNSQMRQEMTYISPRCAKTESVVEGGFVKGLVTYMVMDNLEVMPLSTISGITLLNKLNVKDLSALEEKIVDFGVEEGLKLLKASMECKNVLTSVFLPLKVVNKTSGL
ncbi:uncharacterized protein LOC116112242 [Pistacia vera]|uniref:uncharacterized protein LOC116112242 n=1 Tax=Pistacia vera TaxID=55513 RepID=UPI001263B6B9|nr:uncharacterized protein LOC116112242 [Pistacia vera]